MIYENINFVETYNNANGKGAENLAMSEFAKLLGENKEVVIVALQDTGVRVPSDASNAAIVKLIRNNRNNQTLKKSLGALILANSEVDSYEHFLGKKADGTPRLNLKNIGKIFKKKPKDPNAPAGDKKGSWWSRVFKKDETTGKSKAGSWFTKNKQSINDLGSSLLSGLGKGKNSENVTEGANYHSDKGSNGNKDNGDDKKGMSMMTKIGIGVGVIGLIAFVVWRMRKKGRR